MWQYMYRVRYHTLSYSLWKWENFWYETEGTTSGAAASRWLGLTRASRWLSVDSEYAEGRVLFCVCEASGRQHGTYMYRVDRFTRVKGALQLLSNCHM